MRSSNRSVMAAPALALSDRAGGRRTERQAVIEPIVRSLGAFTTRVARILHEVSNQPRLAPA